MRRLALFLATASTALAASFDSGTVIASDGAAYRQSAYPVITRIANGRLVTAFAVMPKDGPDPYIAASISDDNGRTWSAPVKALDVPAKNDADPTLLWDGRKLFVYSTTVPLKRTVIATSQMFYTTSADGKAWSEPAEIPMPWKYSVGKRHRSFTLLDGSLIMPISWDLWAERGTPARTEGEMNLASGVFKSKDGIEWRAFGWIHTTDPKVLPSSTGGLCEPALVELQSGELYMLLRSGTNHLYETRSKDNGVTWDPPRPSPLVSHNTPAGLWRLDDHPNEIIAIFNHSPLTRYPLSVALSADGGRTWSTPRDVATSNGPQISYPNIVQATDGRFVAVWQAQREDGGRDIRWARFDRDWVLRK